MISRLSAPAASPRSAAWLHELYVNAKWLMIPHAAGVVVRFGSTSPRPALRRAAKGDGHIAHDKTGPDLGLIDEQPQVANACCDMQEVGRFISPEPIVPEPERPQSDS
jgi:hypothetical protein